VRLARHRQEWEDLAAEDLYWSILSDPEKRFGGWSREEFLASGRAEIEQLLQVANRLDVPERAEQALDFGCGAGRLTRALAERFDEVVGVDIALGMLEEARQVNADVPACRFVLNDAPDLRQFDADRFDLVYSSIVLQHIDDASTIRNYIREFVRVVRPGGLVAFQLPSVLPLRHRLQPRRRAYRALRAAGIPRHVLFRQGRLQPIGMRSLAEADVSSVLNGAGARLVEHEALTAAGGVVSSTYYATKGR
jgi:ubiquinone/menaquinone biosynthesis C-methylase UbiE